MHEGKILQFPENWTQSSISLSPDTSCCEYSSIDAVFPHMTAYFSHEAMPVRVAWTLRRMTAGHEAIVLLPSIELEGKWQAYIQFLLLEKHLVQYTQIHNEDRRLAAHCFLSYDSCINDWIFTYLGVPLTKSVLHVKPSLVNSGVIVITTTSLEISYR